MTGSACKPNSLELSTLQLPGQVRAHGAFDDGAIVLRRKGSQDITNGLFQGKVKQKSLLVHWQPFSAVKPQDAVSGFPEGNGSIL